MKFETGDVTDIAHCIALKHEFLCCEDSFEEFVKYASMMIMMAQARAKDGKPSDIGRTRYVAFKAYNAYGRFVHHLYEFLLGVFTRDNRDTAPIRADEAERLIMSNAQRVLNGRRQSILNGTAPSWENHISAFPERVPAEFASEFRAFRNKTTGHVSYERARKSLSEFYNKYHSFLYMMYWNVLGAWGAHRNDVFPDLQEVTDFSVLIRKHPPEGVSSSEGAAVDKERDKAIMDDIWKMT